MHLASEQPCMCEMSAVGGWAEGRGAGGLARGVEGGAPACPPTPCPRSSHTCMAVRCPDACGQTDLSMRTDMATLTFHIRVIYASYTRYIRVIYANLFCGRQTPIKKLFFSIKNWVDLRIKVSELQKFSINDRVTTPNGLEKSKNWYQKLENR